MITTKNKSDILNSEVWDQIIELDKMIQNITTEDKGVTLHFEDLCSRWGDECYPNYILGVRNSLKDFEAGNATISYPVAIDPVEFQTLPTGHTLFWLEFMENSTTFLKSAKIVSLHYYLATDEDDLESKTRYGIIFQKTNKNFSHWLARSKLILFFRAGKWERAAADILIYSVPKDPRFSLLKVYASTIQGVSDEASDNIIRVIPYLFVSEVIVGAYAIFSMMMKDWILSKPWLGLAAVYANCLGCLAGIGLMQFIGVDFITINMGVPFIMLGKYQPIFDLILHRCDAT